MSFIDEYTEMLRRFDDELVELRYQAALLDLQLALRAFDPHQPRAPAGNPGGGQWTSGGDPAARIIDIADQTGKNPPPPPGYDPNTWKEGKYGNGKSYLEDPDGNRYLLHKEDKGHWRHWDIEDKDGTPRGRLPPNSKKPHAGQKRLNDEQSTTDPSGDATAWTPREMLERPPIPVLPIDPAPIPELPPIFDIPPVVIPP